MVAAGKSLILTGHTSTERPYLANVLKARLEKELEHEDGGGWEIVVSKEDAEPFVTV
jgi:putative NIF3 family GTP cyclohydrolase 1 type 2